jgi:hypothetical protein
VGLWSAVNKKVHFDLLKRQDVELAINDLTSATDQASMMALLKKLPTALGQTAQAIENNQCFFKITRENKKGELSYVARGIQLARFQQALLHTSNGQRFFPGKSDIAGNPGRRVFEGFIEIEDLACALELFVARKKKSTLTSASPVQEKLAQRPYYYPHDITAACEAAALAAGNGGGLVLSGREETGEPVDHETRTSTTSTPSRSVAPELRAEDRAEPIETGVLTGGGTKRTYQETTSDGEADAQLEQTDENLRKLVTDKNRLEEKRIEMMQKQKDSENELSCAKQKQRDVQDRVAAYEEKLMEARKELEDGEDDLQRIETVRQASVSELRKLETRAKLLSVGILQANNKRKRVELEREERLAEKQMQALEIEIEEE